MAGKNFASGIDQHQSSSPPCHAGFETLLARPQGAALAPADDALARSMIEDSDNDAATSLWDEDGGAAGLTYYGDRAGLTKTTPSQCVTCAGFACPGWGLTTTVPQDQLTLLKQLVVPGPSPLLSARARSYALSLMENVDRRPALGGLRRRPRRACTVALKNGWLPLDDGRHRLAGQQRRLGLRRRPRLPDRRAHHRQPDRAVRHRHHQRAVVPDLDRDALTRPRVTAGRACTG